MYGEENNQLSIYRDYQRIQLLHQWLDSNIQVDLIDNENDIYFDCVEQQELIDCEDQFYSTSHPFISEIWLSVHRKTGIFRRFLNYFNRSREQSLIDLAEEFVRRYGGQFNHPIGFHFHLSCSKQKWLFILQNIKIIDSPIYSYPQTRIILIRKGISFLAR